MRRQMCSDDGVQLKLEKSVVAVFVLARDATDDIVVAERLSASGKCLSHQRVELSSLYTKGFEK